MTSDDSDSDSDPDRRDLVGEAAAADGVPDLPERRSPADVEASYETLIQELTLVTERHNSDLSHAEIVVSCFDFADSYAEVYDIPLDVRLTTTPRGTTAAAVHITPPPQDDADEYIGLVGRVSPEDIAASETDYQPSDFYNLTSDD